MNSKFVRVGLTTCVLVLAFGGLLWSTLRDGTEYYKHVEEVSVQPEAWYGKKLQLHGFVVPDSILRKRDSLDYRFQVQSKGAVIPASYTRHRARHVQGRSGSGAEGHAHAARVHRGAERRDGEVPVEVRAEAGRAGAAASRRLIGDTCHVAAMAAATPECDRALQPGRSSGALV